MEPIDGVRRELYLCIAWMRRLRGGLVSKKLLSRKSCIGYLLDNLSSAILVDQKFTQRPDAMSWISSVMKLLIPNVEVPCTNFVHFGNSHNISQSYYVRYPILGYPFCKIQPIYLPIDTILDTVISPGVLRLFAWVFL